MLMQEKFIAIKIFSHYKFINTASGNNRFIKLSCITVSYAS